MTAQEALKAVLDWMNGDGPEPDIRMQVGEHGPVVDVKMAAYGDWYIYEDGYEEYRSIGD